MFRQLMFHSSSPLLMSMPCRMPSLVLMKTLPSPTAGEVIAAFAQFASDLDPATRGFGAAGQMVDQGRSGGEVVHAVSAVIFVGLGLTALVWG